ncbi:MAG: hypothetical protein Q9222_000767 [Ikaeria aurantiellina]
MAPGALKDTYELHEILQSPTSPAERTSRRYHDTDATSETAEENDGENCDSLPESTPFGYVPGSFTSVEERAVLKNPRTYIASCVAAWGVIASLQALATSYASLCVLRALLGISEAAFSPGVPVFLAFFYKRDELAFRIGLFISAAPLATSFASSLAWLITRLGQQSPIASWRMLFLVEGFPSVLVSVVAFYYVPNSPGEARYLSKRERKVAELRLRHGKPEEAQHGHSHGKFQWTEIWEALKDPKCYLTAGNSDPSLVQRCIQRATNHTTSGEWLLVPLSCFLLVSRFPMASAALESKALTMIDSGVVALATQDFGKKE